VQSVGDPRQGHTNKLTRTYDSLFSCQKRLCFKGVTLPGENESSNSNPVIDIASSTLRPSLRLRYSCRSLFLELVSLFNVTLARLKAVSKLKGGPRAHFSGELLERIDVLLVQLLVPAFHVRTCL
jgi:hypothetical protein